MLTAITLRPALRIAGHYLFPVLIVVLTLAKSEADEPGTPQYTNSLVNSTSPYLLQHAHNPVDWHSWGEEAFALAREQNKPIFVSVGYSTCYWCHVMERESFEDKEVADVLNAHFIAIKVDREQLPDIDEQLMLTTQLMTGRGGWPNSVWLTPERRPWMAGTYYPKPHFMQLLKQLASIWQTQPNEVQARSRLIAERVRQASALPRIDRPAPITLQSYWKLIQHFEQTFDAERGGFGDKPKFPPHTALRLLALVGDSSPEPSHMLHQTLDHMYAGGIHDHVGGGFHRYSTDAHWHLPHFEKMLYDNAQIMRAFCDAQDSVPSAIAATRYAYAVDRVFQWLQREMTHPGGGFYSALDSESEGGHEGLYYTWTVAELQAALNPDAAQQFANAFGFDPTGNFEDESAREKTGRNVPFLPYASLGDLPHQTFEQVLLKLNAHRQQRAFPHRDDKILAGWNGMMIAALARASEEFENSDYLDAATQAAAFVLEQMHDPDEGLMRSWRSDRAAVPAYLSDYAYLIDGLLEVYNASHDEQWLDAAEKLSQEMLDKFIDAEAGGFFFTSQQHDMLLVRSKNLFGGGNVPNANGVAVQNLVRLADWTNNEFYRETARQTLNSFAKLIDASPQQAESIVLANALYLQSLSQKQASPSANQPSFLVIGEARSDATTALLSKAGESLLCRLSAGNTLPIRCTLDIAPGFHINATEVGAVELLPTEFALVDPTGKFTFSEIDAPSGTSRPLEFLAGTARQYTGQAVLRAELLASPDLTPGMYEIQFRLRFQECDDTRCLEPREFLFPLSLQIID